MPRKIVFLAWNCFIDVLRHKVISMHLIFVIFAAGLFHLFSHFSTTPELEYKMIQDIGISLISLFGFLMTLLIGVSTLREEINRKTAYAILTLAISRREFYLGKFFGTVLATSLNISLMVAVFTIMIFLKFGTFWLGCIWITLFLCLELSIISSLVLLFSLTDSTILAFSFSFFMVILGNFSNYITHLIKEIEIPFIFWGGKVLFTIIPNFGVFNIKTSILKTLTIPLSVTGWAIAYSFFYLVFSVGIGTYFMEKKDL